MCMKVTQRRATEEEWWRHANGDSTATFFQTPYWFQVVGSHLGFKTRPIYVELPNGKSGVFPLADRSLYKGIAREFISSPGGTYGGLVSSFELHPAELDVLENSVIERTNFIYRVNPLRVAGRTFTGQMNEDFTHLLDLKSLDPSNVLRRWRKGHKADAKKALREGVLVSTKNDDNVLQDYYAAYLDSLRRWGRAAARYDLELFRKLLALPQAYVKLWQAFYKERLIYGCLCFYFGKHVVYWHGAGLSEFFSLGAVHLLQWRIIEDAMVNGFRYYDFNPSGGIDGVVHFKEGFGTDKVDAPVMKGRAWFTKVLDKLHHLRR